MVTLNYAVCNSKKSRVINEQEACGLLRTFGIETPLKQIAIACTI